MNYNCILAFCISSLLALTLTAQQSLIPAVNYYDEIATAQKHYKNKGYAHALHAYEQALSTPSAKKGDYYNAACCASLIGDLDKANTYLNKSIELGYWDLKWMSNVWGYLHRESKEILVPASFDKVGFAGDCLEIKYKSALFSIDVQTKINLKYQDEPSNSHQQVFKVFNPPGIDSSGALKGFKVNEKGYVSIVSKDFDQP